VSLALFYPAQLARADLVDLVRGRELSAPLDVIDLAEPAPPRAERELAVPFLPGMDDVEVTEARLALRAATRLLDTEDYTVTANGSQGIFLSLSAPARLRKVELTYTLPPLPPPNLRVVVRAATPSGSTSTAGTPLFAFPAFGAPGPMFPAVLGGMSVTELGGNRRLLTLPPGVLGQAWLIQLAAGDEATKLDPGSLAIVPTVQRVALEAAPRNLSIVLQGDDGDVKLWNNPEALLPDAGEQEVSFTPLAQKELAAALARQNAATGAAVPTLPVRLRFDSETVGALDITARALAAEYLVRPLGADRLSRRLAGSPVTLTLSAPAGLTPASSQVRLTVKHLGRELNAASPEPPAIPPAGGLRVAAARQVATAMAVAPRDGAAPGSVLQLASARLPLAASEPSEAVLEIRGDLAGAPGPLVAAPVVQQLGGSFSDWLEFVLAEPLDVVTGQAPLWLALRVNRGDVRWFASPSAPATARVSADRGQTWGAPDPKLLPATGLLAQLFHRVADDAPAPALRLQRADGVVMASIALTPQPRSPREFVADTALPPAVHALLEGRAGDGKARTDLQLFSRSALDVTVDALLLRYDPFGARRTVA
jgi:hypothetical protein